MRGRVCVCVCVGQEVCEGGTRQEPEVPVQEHPAVEQTHEVDARMHQGRFKVAELPSLLKTPHPVFSSILHLR